MVEAPIQEHFSVLSGRDKRQDNYCYKLHSDNRYGLDVSFENDMDIDEKRMSVWVPFADGKRRDGVGDLLEIGGIRTERHRVNPICLYDHGKTVSLPIGLSEDRDTKAYTVELDPVNQLGRANTFFYQGTGLTGVGRDKEFEHAVLCEQLFDLVAKRLIRAGSIGYQVIKAQPLQPDYQNGTPQGLHLLSVLMLEYSIVVLPANGDTVRKMLSLPQVCGKRLSPYLVKSFEAYAPMETKTVSGYEGKPEDEKEQFKALRMKYRGKGMVWTVDMLDSVQKLAKRNGVDWNVAYDRESGKLIVTHENGRNIEKPIAANDSAIREELARITGKQVSQIKSLPYRSKGMPNSIQSTWDKIKRGERVVVSDETLDAIGSYFQNNDDPDDHLFSRLASLPNPNQVGIRDRYIAFLKGIGASKSTKTVSGYEGKVKLPGEADKPLDEFKALRMKYKVKAKQPWEADYSFEDVHGRSGPKYGYTVFEKDGLWYIRVFEVAFDREHQIMGPWKNKERAEKEAEKLRKRFGSKSLPNVRQKYRSAKNYRRRLRKSVSGSSVLNIHEKDIYAARKMAEQSGLKFYRGGSQGNGLERIKLMGDDESIDQVAKRFGKSLKPLEKNLYKVFIAYNKGENSYAMEHHRLIEANSEKEAILEAAKRMNVSAYIDWGKSTAKLEAQDNKSIKSHSKGQYVITRYDMKGTTYWAGSTWTKIPTESALYASEMVAMQEKNKIKDNDSNAMISVMKADEKVFGTAHFMEGKTLRKDFQPLKKSSSDISVFIGILRRIPQGGSKVVQGVSVWRGSSSNDYRFPDRSNQYRIGNSEQWLWESMAAEELLRMFSKSLKKTFENQNKEIEVLSKKLVKLTSKIRG